MARRDRQLEHLFGGVAPLIDRCAEYELVGRCRSLNHRLRRSSDVRISRREFMRDGVAAFTVTFAAPSFMADVARAQAARSRNLVVLYLSGGNDALSMLVPYTEPLYYKRRPLLAVPRRVRRPGESPFPRPAVVLQGLRATVAAHRRARAYLWNGSSRRHPLWRHDRA